MEAYLTLLLVAGGGIFIAGYLWLWLRAYREHRLWGLGGFLVVPLLVFLFRAKRSPSGPSWLMLLGLAAVAVAFGTNLYERYFPNLGPLDRLVEGERHLTLTGWNRNDYSFLSMTQDVVVLQMANRDVDDAVLKRVAGNAGLKKLDVANSSITDGGLAALTGLAKLESLVLSNTQVTTAGVEKLLAALPSLKLLDVRGTSVDPELLRKWRDAAPGRRVLPTPPRKTAPTATIPDSPRP